MDQSRIESRMEQAVREFSPHRHEPRQVATDVLLEWIRQRCLTSLFGSRELRVVIEALARDPGAEEVFGVLVSRRREEIEEIRS